MPGPVAAHGRGASVQCVPTRSVGTRSMNDGRGKARARRGTWTRSVRPVCSHAERGNKISGSCQAGKPDVR
jgi:hypothetical protein